MARWKTIESAPIGRSILVDGGTIEFTDGHGQGNYPVTEPMKVRYDGEDFSVSANEDAYIRNPIYWTELPTRALELELPRPASADADKSEYDL